MNLFKKHKFEINKKFLILSAFLFFIIFIPGCVKKETGKNLFLFKNEENDNLNKFDNNLENQENNLVFSDFANMTSVEEEEVEVYGFLFLPNSFNYEAFNDQKLHVCDYDLVIDSTNKDSIIQTGNIIRELYIQNEWIMEEPIMGNSYIMYVGEKIDKIINIVILYKNINKNKFNKNKFNSMTIKVHQSIIEKN